MKRCSQYLILLAALFAQVHALAAFGHGLRRGVSNLMNRNKPALHRAFTQTTTPKSGHAAAAAASQAPAELYIPYTGFIPIGNPFRERTVPILPADPEERRKFLDSEKIRKRAVFES